MAQSKVWISEAYWGEDHLTHGGKEGDQMKQRKSQEYNETQTVHWKERTSGSGRWRELIRCNDEQITKKVIITITKIVNCGLVGYDQWQRNTLYYELEKNKWNVDNYIKSGIPTETDCAALVYTAYCVHVPGLRDWMIDTEQVSSKHRGGKTKEQLKEMAKVINEKGWSNPAYCGNIANVFDTYGYDYGRTGQKLFSIIRDVDNINKDSYLQIGDLLNDPKFHVVMVVSTNDKLPIQLTQKEMDFADLFKYDYDNYPRTINYNPMERLFDSLGMGPGEAYENFQNYMLRERLRIAGAGGESTNSGGGTQQLGSHGRTTHRGGSR